MEFNASCTASCVIARIRARIDGPPAKMLVLSAISFQ